LIKKVM